MRPHTIFNTFAFVKTATTVSILLSVLLAFAALDAQAQCRKFAKKACGDVLTGYTPDGTMEGEQLFEGEWRTYNRMFYSGVDYRVAVCVDEKVKEGTWFEVLDSNGKSLHNSKETGEFTWDFNVSSGIALDVVIHMPEKPEDRYFRNMGCVTLMIGFMP